MSVTVSLPSDQLALLGRVNQYDDRLAFDWTNTGVYFRFRGKKVSFRFDVPALAQNLFVKIKLDNKSARLCVCENSTVIEMIADYDGEHTVSCVRVNEILDAVPLVLREIVLEGDSPMMLERPALPERKMLFIGDSITCGFGILTQGAGNGFKTAEQDGSQTYAALTAAHFQAQAHFVCISGRGIARNCDNYQAPRIPEFFEWTSISDPTAWNHTQYQPDVIVVNAGTNDTAGEESPVDLDVFKNEVKSFATRLLTVYPNAKLIWCYGMMAIDMHDALCETIESLQNPNATFMSFQSVYEYKNETGAASHPNQRAHYRCAGVLIDQIQAVTGWEK